MKTVDGENMEQHKLEQISALMDEQLDLKEQDVALENLLNDIETQKVWQEYHLIRDCLQNNQTKTRQQCCPFRIIKSYLAQIFTPYIIIIGYVI